VDVAKPGSIAVPDLDLDLDLELDLDLLPTYSNICKLVRESRVQGLSAQCPALRMLAVGFLSAVRRTGSAAHEQAVAVTLARAMGLEPSLGWLLRMPLDVPLDVVQGLMLELKQGQQCATVVTIVNGVRTVRTTGLFAELFGRAEAGPPHGPHGPLSDAWGAIIDTPLASRQLTGAVVNDMLRLTDQHWRGQPPRLHWETELLGPVRVRCTEGHAFQARLHVEAALALGGQVQLWHLCVTDIKPLSPGATPRLRALAGERVGPANNDLDFDQLHVEGHGRLARPGSHHSLKLSMQRD
jgi:hypothetical protein